VKKVKLMNDELEYQHNLVTRVSPNAEDDVMFSQDRAFLIMFWTTIQSTQRFEEIWKQRKK